MKLRIGMAALGLGLALMVAAAAKVPTKLEVRPASIVVGNTITLSATITRTDTGQGVWNVPLKFTLGGRTLGVTNSNASGQAYFRYPVEELFPSDGKFKPAKYRILVQFAGDKYFGSSWGDNDASVFIATPRLELANVRGKVGKPVELRAIMRRSNDAKPVVGRSLRFTLNNRDVGSARTDATGLARLTVKVPTPGNNTIGASWAGDRYYADRQANASLWGDP